MAAGGFGFRGGALARAGALAWRASSMFATGAGS
jgi:hypothetical protein